MIRKLLFFYCTFIVSNLVFSQNQGKYFIDNYNRSDYNASIANWQAVQDSNGLIYIANYDGVLQFDGENWTLIPLLNNEIVLSISIDDKNNIYIGSQKDFGYLKPDIEGKLKFSTLKHLIKQNVQISNISSITASNLGVYFVSKNAIFKYSDDKIKIIKSDSNKFNHYLHIIDKEAFLIKKGNGLIKINQSDKITPIEGTNFLSNNLLSLVEKKTNGNILLGTSSSGFFYYNKNGINKITNSTVEPILKRDKLLFAKKLPLTKSNSYALSTSKGRGIIITNNINEISNIIDKSKGLLSDNIRHIFFDSNNNLWASLQKGVSKIELISPWKFWDSSNDLKGTPWSIMRFNGRIIIASTEGLYQFKNSKIERIDNINGKIWDLEISKINNNKEILLAGSYNGLYKINKNSKKQIFNLIEVYKIINSTKSNSVIVGHINGLSKITYLNDHYQEYPILRKPRATYNDIIEHNNNIWVSAKFTGVYKISDIDKKKPSNQLFNINHGLKDVNQINILNNDNKLLFTTDNGIYKYNEQNPDSLKFTPDTTIIKERKAIKLARLDPFGNYWFVIAKDRKQYVEQYIKQIDGTFKRNYIPFKRLPDSEIIDIYPEEDSVVWFATSTGLYRYDPKVPKDYNLPFNTHIRKTITSDSVIFYGHYYDPSKKEEVPSILYEQPDAFKPSLTYENNNITFEYSASFYEVPEKTEFSYYLENNDKHWSHWSTATKKEYNNLSAGKYTFHVKAKNIYETIGRTATYEFTILPPWYQTAWAYVLFTISGLFFIGFVAYAYSYRIMLQRRKLKLIVADRTFEVLSQKKEIEKQHHLLKSKNEEIEEQRDDIQEKNQQLQNHQEEILTINSMLTEMNATLEKTVERRTSKIKSTLKILQKTNKELDTFVYRASHDLKGPISRIIGLISLIKFEAKGDTKYDEYFNLIETNSEEMEVLLSKLTEVHEIFNKDVHKEEVEFNDLLIEARNKYAFLEKDKPTQFHFNLDEDSQIFTDLYIYGVVIHKVLENALTFRKSPNDNHEVEISSTKRGKIFHVKITDSGDGIEDEIKGKVFDMFYRGSEKSRGNGLGLYIVKMGLDKLGGKISLKTEANHFTEFTISIPLDRSLNKMPNTL